MKYMADQLSPQKVVLNAQDIATSSKQLLRTNMPAKELGQFADLVLKSRGEKISSVSLVPPQISVTAPDFGRIHRMIAKAIRKSEEGPASPSPSASPTEEKKKDKSPGPNGAANTDNPREANTTDDLAEAC
jgi:hypothetical protein